MNYKAVVFDLDGTLLDTLEDLGDSMNIVLQKMGFQPHALDKYKYFVGDGMITLAERALPQEHLDIDTVKQCAAAMKEEYNKRWYLKTKLYDGITDLLDGLTARKIKIAVLSNKPHDFTRIVVDKYLGRWHFDAVFGERPNIPKKPNPTGAVEISRLFDIPPKDFLYLGDTNVDMLTANTAGMYAVGASWGFRSVNELLENGAKTIIDHPTELIKLL